MTQAFWRRPIWPEIWLPVTLGVGILLASADLLPFVLARIEWHRNPAIGFWGRSYELPEGWVRDPTGLPPLTLRKPRLLYLLTRPDSELTIEHERPNSPAVSEEDRWQRWLRFFPAARREQTEFAGRDGSSGAVRCAVEPINLYGTVSLSAHCISGPWNFSYIGDPQDFRSAEDVMVSFARDTTSFQ